MELKLFGFKFNLGVLVLIIIVVLISHLLCGCSRVSPMEAFSMMSGKEGFGTMNNGETFSKFPNKPVNPNSWKMSNIGVAGKARTSLLNQGSNPSFPLPSGQLSIYDNMDFKPECCASGSDASNSMGCACYNLNTVSYLRRRGGNAGSESTFVEGSSF